MNGTRHPGLVFKLRPAGPWRIGPDSGARDSTDIIYHSDSLYSAVSGVMRLLGSLDEWLDATARSSAGPAVRFSSLFPFQNEVGFVIPPRSVWPPPASTRVRWKGARFVPLGLIAPLLAGRGPDEEQWDVDGPSECLVPAGRSGPFRSSMCSAAAVDRISGHVEPHSVAGIEFSPGSGLWAVVAFADEQQRDRWSAPVQSALRLLADSGFGGERARGWGRSEPPEFIEGWLPEMILPEPGAEVSPAVPEAASPAAAESTEAAPPNEPPAPAEAVSAYWLLSLFSPSPADAVDWNRGNYSIITRAGRIDSPVRSGSLKKLVQMVSEGSVLVAANPVEGAAPDVAPDDFPHPVYRAGFALAVPIRWQAAS